MPSCIIYVPRLPQKTISTRSESRAENTHLSPQQPPMVIDRALDSPRNPSKPPKVGHDQKGHNTKRDTLGMVLPPRREDAVIEDMGKHQYREVQRRELSREVSAWDTDEEQRRGTHVVMDVGYPAHDKERHCRMHPSDTIEPQTSQHAP